MNVVGPSLGVDAIGPHKKFLNICDTEKLLVDQKAEPLSEVILDLHHVEDYTDMDRMFSAYNLWQ